MTRSPLRALGRIDPAARRWVAGASLAILLVALAIVLFAALRCPLKDDIAWLLYVARRWMTGRELYVDVVEINPPLIVWISAVPLKLATWLDLEQQLVAMPFFVAVVLACAWWTADLMRAAGGVFVERIPVFAAIGTVLLALPGTDLGQREHLLAAAILPYLVLFARSLDGARPTLPAAILSGVLAALGCALKPRYAGVFIVLEAIALLRGLRPWRVMPIAAGATLAAYAGLVVLLCPAYLQRAVPLALALYGATDVPFTTLLVESAPLLFGEAVGILLLLVSWRGMRERNLILTLVAFAVVSTVICFVDGKNWFYHRLPATVATVLALLCWTTIAHHGRVIRRPWSEHPIHAANRGRGGTHASLRSDATALLRDRLPPERRFILPAMAAGAALFVFGAGAVQRMQAELALAMDPNRTIVAKLEALVRKEHVHSYVAFSEWLALGFPVVNNTGVAWASRFDSMWALKGELWRARLDTQAAAEWPVRRWVTHDFIAGCPDLAVVDTREGTNYIAVLSASDPAFARAWTQYRKIAVFDGIDVYRRAKGGCVNPWVAAEAKVAALK